MKIGIIASLAGTAMLAYDHYLYAISQNQYLIALFLIIIGIFFYIFLERE
jgi:hypothetical protein